MRAFSRDAFEKMRLQMDGMEFATEMVVAAINSDLKIYEVPVNYFRRKGTSKLKSFSDAWRHIRFMLLFCPVWLYFIPGIAGFSAGMLILLLLTRWACLFPGAFMGYTPYDFCLGCVYFILPIAPSWYICTYLCGRTGFFKKVTPLSVFFNAISISSAAY